MLDLRLLLDRISSLRMMDLNRVLSNCLQNIFATVSVSIFPNLVRTDIEIYYALSAKELCETRSLNTNGASPVKNTHSSLSSSSSLTADNSAEINIIDVNNFSEVSNLDPEEELFGLHNDA